MRDSGKAQQCRTEKTGTAILVRLNKLGDHQREIHRELHLCSITPAGIMPGSHVLIQEQLALVKLFAPSTTCSKLFRGAFHITPEPRS